MNSCKKPLKSWDDVRHGFDDILKRTVDRFTWHRNILERYKNGDRTIRAHCYWISGLPSSFEIGQSLRGDIGGRESIAPPIMRVYKSADVACNQEENSVLICVHEFAQPQERFIPSTVRLNAIDL